MPGGTLVEKLRIIRLGQRRNGERVAAENSGSRYALSPPMSRWISDGSRRLTVAENIKIVVRQPPLTDSGQARGTSADCIGVRGTAGGWIRALQIRGKRSETEFSPKRDRDPAKHQSGGEELMRTPQLRLEFCQRDQKI